MSCATIFPAQSLSMVGRSTGALCTGTERLVCPGDGFFAPCPSDIGASQPHCLVESNSMGRQKPRRLVRAQAQASSRAAIPSKADLSRESRFVVDQPIGPLFRTAAPKIAPGAPLRSVFWIKTAQLSASCLFSSASGISLVTASPDHVLMVSMAVTALT